MAPRLCKCYNSPTTPLKVLWRKFTVTASLKVGRHVNAFLWKKYLGKLELYVQLFLSLSWLCSSLVPRLSRAPSSFWSLAVCKNGGGRPSLFYHVNDVSVYLGRQRGGGSPRAFRARILHFEPGAVSFSLSERLKLQCLGQKLQEKASSSFLWQGTPPPSIYQGRHWHHSRDKMDQASKTAWWFTDESPLIYTSSKQVTWF